MSGRHALLNTHSNTAERKTMYQDTDHSHRALHNEALINAVWAAEKGWAPADILHVLGPKVHPLLYRAAPRVPARISSPVLRKQWLQLAPPRSGSLILPEETPPSGY